MKHRYSLILAAVAAACVAACSTTPETIEELETARAVVPQVEASPRAGVAVTNITEARKALDRANALVEKHGKLADIQYEAAVANRNAQIANEKILTAQARDDVDKGTVERQAVLTAAREREATRNAQQAQSAEERASALERELADLKGKKTDRGVVVTMGDVLFDTGKATLKPGAYATVDRLATVLKEDQQRKVLIEGHTDSVGTDAYNQALSDRRAKSVFDYLSSRGVDPARLKSIGKGEGEPIADNRTAEGRQDNRRVLMIRTDTGR